jgi:hypothetical protein
MGWISMGIIKRFVKFILFGLLFALPMCLLYQGVVRYSAEGILVDLFVYIVFLCIAFNLVTLLEYVVRDRLALYLALFIVFGIAGVLVGWLIGSLPFSGELPLQPSAFVYWGTMVLLPVLVSVEAKDRGRAEAVVLRLTTVYFAVFSAFYLLLAVAFEGKPSIGTAIDTAAIGTLILLYFHLRYFLALRKSEKRKNTDYIKVA